MRLLTELLTYLPDIVHTTNIVAEITIAAAVFDSRKVTSQTLFVAWPGRTADSHRYITQAVAQGAAAVIGTTDLQTLAAQNITLLPDVPYIQVQDSRRALAICAAALHNFPSRNLAVIGITGTDGKTTTCTLLEAILKQATITPSALQGRVGVITTVSARIRGAEIDTGLHVTTPDAPDVQRFLAQMRDADCTYAVVESTSHGLNQRRVAAVDFDVAGVTNITHEHLDEHGTREAYVAAKALLFRALFAAPPKGNLPRCAVLNADDAGSYDALRTVLAEEAARHTQAVTVRSYGVQTDATANRQLDVLATDLVYEPARTRFQLQWWGGAFAVETGLIGEFNVSNVLCAATVALSLNLEPATIQRSIASFVGVLGRMERIDEGQPFLAVVDFAHSPVSLERALLTLRKLVGHDDAGNPGRLIAVFGSAGLRDRAKRRLMGQVSGRLADYTVITAEDPRTEDLALINAEIAAGVAEHAPTTAFTIVADRSAAIQSAVNLARPGDVVAAFGKGHERSICFGEIEYPWSDQAAMRTALAARNQ